MKGRFTEFIGVAACMAVMVFGLTAPGVCDMLLPTGPDHAPGQMMVTLKPGYREADMRRVASANGMTIVKSLPVPNTYLVKWGAANAGTRTVLSGVADDVYVKCVRVARNAAVASVSPNHYRYAFAVPNDPRYSEQWHYPLIRMPQAWDIEKGSDTVIVAVLDTGISLTHPDIISRLVSGIDIANGDNDPGFNDKTESDHGLHVAGTIAADTDNGVGVAGVCWSGVKIMPVKVFQDEEPGATDDWIIEGLDWAMNNGAKVVNMSLGGPGTNSAMQAKITELVNAGIVIVAAAGNTGDSEVHYPAAFDGVIAVSAVNRDGVLSNYSTFGSFVDIAGPGGEQTSENDPNGVLSLRWHWDAVALAGVDEYGFMQGTSMACPHVAGAAALLLSFGVNAADVERILESSATDAGLPGFDEQYGAGILNVAGAFEGVASIGIVRPKAAEKINTSVPSVRALCSNIDKTTLKVYLGSNVDTDNDGIPDDGSTPIIDDTNVDSYYDVNTGVLEFQLALRDATSPTEPVAYPIAPKNPLLVDNVLAPGTYRLYMTANREFGVSTALVTASRVFFVEPKIIRAGLFMASVPYPLLTTDNDPLTFDDPMSLTRGFFGTNAFKMSRWLPEFNAYATFNFPSLLNDARATLLPPDMAVQPHSATSLSPPAGVGYWLRADSDISVLANAFSDLTNAYDIPLKAGWNMIGDPFPFKVDWNGVMVTYQGRSVPIISAVALGWLRPSIYRYNTAGYYTVQTLPAGTFVPWEGNWVLALKGTETSPLVLSVPPIPSATITVGAR